MKCTILYNYFDDETDLQYCEFNLALDTIGGYYELSIQGVKAIIIIIQGSEYCFMHDDNLLIALDYELQRRKKYNLN